MMHFYNSCCRKRGKKRQHPISEEVEAFLGNQRDARKEFLEWEERRQQREDEIEAKRRREDREHEIRLVQLITGTFPPPPPAPYPGPGYPYLPGGNDA